MDVDLNAPMDAPIRAREAREKAEHDAAMEYMRSPEFEAKIREVVARIPKPDASEQEKLAKVVTEIRRIAKTVGWAVGEHGTKVRDLDLIAVPWDGHACSREALIGEILKVTHALLTEVNPKPHGRIGYILHGYGPKMIDLSCFTPSGRAEA